MRKLILIIPFILFVTNVFAQKLTFGDLKFIHEHNLPEVKTYLFAKGFKYTDNLTADEKGRIHTFLFTKWPKSANEIKVIKSTINGKPFTTGFTTKSENDLVKFKDTIIQIGYSLYKDPKMDNSTIMYKNGDLIIGFTATRANGKLMYMISYFNKEIMGFEPK